MCYMLILANGSHVLFSSLATANDARRMTPGSYVQASMTPQVVTMASLLHRFDSPLAGKE